MPHPPREELLASTLSALDGMWLNISCPPPCTGCLYPLKLMARERGGKLVLRDVLARLRCKRCHQRPPLVRITDNPAPAPGMDPPWSVVLVP